MKTTLIDREFDKFRESADGKSAVAVKLEDSVNVNIEGVDWDEIQTTFPQANQELFTYKKDSVVVQTVLVTYDSSSKKDVLKLEKTRF